jgi:hypothetical protein
MVDDKIFTNSGRTTRQKVSEHLRPGEIHTYNDRQMQLINHFTRQSTAMDGRRLAPRRAV